MGNRKICLVVILAFIFLNACGPKGDLQFNEINTPSGSSSIGPISPSFNSLSTELFSKQCLICHSGISPDGNYDLSTLTSATANNVVRAFDPDNSPLYLRIADGSMPPTGELPQEVKDAIYEWIRRGAPLDTTPLPQPLQFRPIVSAGPDQIINTPASSTQLIGTATDSNGRITSVAWTQLSGPSAVITNANALSSNVSELVPGTYVFQLSATDDFGESSSDTIQVIVNAVVGNNNPPTANAGADRSITLPTNSLTLSGSGSDTDGTIASYLWSQVSGPSTATFATPTAASTLISNLVAGSYNFQLRVIDNDGAAAVDTVIVSVNNEAVLPTYSSISRLILQPKCVECHGPVKVSARYRVDSYSSTMAGVVAGNPTSSVLYQSIMDNSMPKGRTPLSTAEKEAVRVWILSGALNN